MKKVLFAALACALTLGMMSCKKDKNVDTIVMSSELSMKVGETAKLDAKLSSGAAATFLWGSSDNSVAIVVDGTVTALKEGSAIITAAVDGIKATCTVTVTKRIASFEIKTSKLGATIVTISTTPSDDNVVYYFDIAEKGSIDLTNPTALVAECKTNFDETIDYYGEYGYELTYGSFASKGADSYDFTGLTPETEYVAYAFQFDTITCTFSGEKIYSIEFTTGVQKTVDMTFSIRVDTSYIEVTPSLDNEYYYWTYVETADLEEYDSPEEYILEEVEYYQSWGYNYDELVYQGVDGYDYSEYMEEGTAYTVIAAGYEGDGLTTAAATYEFTYSATPANAPARVAAVSHSKVKKGIKHEPVLRLKKH